MKKKRSKANKDAEVTVEFQPVGLSMIKPYRILKSLYTRTNNWPIVVIPSRKMSQDSLHHRINQKGQILS